MQQNHNPQPSFLELDLVPSEPSFNKVGTVLAAVRLLDAPDCRGRLRSPEAAIVASLTSWQLLFLVRKIDRRVLASDIDAELGVITCVWSRIGHGQTVHPSSGIAHWFSLIPVSGVGVAEDGCEDRKKWNFRNIQKRQ